MPAVSATPAPMREAPLREEAGLFRSSSRNRVLMCLLLAVVTLALYNPAARNGFVNFDDDRYVTNNPEVRAGLHWSTISWAFTSFEQANWHPLTWISHALDCQIFHLNPTGHHYTNVLLHALNALLVFLILHWFTGYAGRSLMVAALFALHPLNVESVAWVAERKNVLCMFFFLLALAAYGWYVQRPAISRYVFVALLFGMALMSKPMAITLPFVLLLLDYWPLGRMRFAGKLDSGEIGIDSGNEERARFETCSHSVTRLFVEKIPLLALSAGSAIITLIAQRAGGAVLTSASQATGLRLENVVLSYGLYIKKTIWPTHLAALYPYPHALPLWQVAVSALFLVAVTCLVIKHRERRYLAVGWFWYLGTMVPMIGLLQVGNQAMADRYAYLPAIGLFIMIVWIVAEWASAYKNSTQYLAATGITALLALSTLTHSQIAYWHDDFSLWSHALAVTQNNYVGENNFAYALIKQGRYDDAIVHFRAASALEPGDPASQLNLGIYSQEHGDLQEAAARYAQVLQLATDSQLRASAYANLGTVYFARHDYIQAQINFDAAARLKFTFPVALLDMGLIAQKTAATPEDWKHAASYFAQFVAVAPNDVGYFLLAHALQQTGRGDEANLAYRHALQLSPDIRQTQQRAAQLAAQ